MTSCKLAEPVVSRLGQSTLCDLLSDTLTNPERRELRNPADGEVHKEPIKPEPGPDMPLLGLCRGYRRRGLRQASLSCL